MMKSNRNVFVLTLFVLSVFVFAFVSMARAEKTCAEMFPGESCHNGVCAIYSTGGNCVINGCWCDLIQDYVQHDCETGEDAPPCEEPEPK